LERLDSPLCESAASARNPLARYNAFGRALDSAEHGPAHQAP
jgi:hypothetical protein